MSVKFMNKKQYGMTEIITVKRLRTRRGNSFLKLRFELDLIWAAPTSLSTPFKKDAVL